MSFDYSADNYSNHAYSGIDDPFRLNGVVGSVIEVYESGGAFKSFYQTGSGNFLGVEFTIDESGSRDFTLFFSDFVDITKKDIIRIRLFNQEEYFFTGVVRRTPIEGSTKTDYSYSGYGLNDYLIRANTESKIYAGDTVNDIVNDLLDTIITVKTPINKNLSKIAALDTVVTSIEFKYISCQDALQQLKEIMQGDGTEYRVGVDREGDFFFLPRTDEIKANLVVGKVGRFGIEEYQPEDSIEEKTKLFVLDKNGSYITTVVSSIANDIFEQKVTAPDIATADIPNWAQGVLTDRETTTRKASITWQISPQTPEVIIGDGKLRIISNIPSPDPTPLDIYFYGDGLYGSGLYGGEQYAGKDLDDKLKIVEVNYVVNSNTAVRTIQLGDTPIRLERQVLDVNKNIEDLRVSLGR